MTWVLPQMGGGPFLIITDREQRDEDHPLFWECWLDHKPGKSMAPPSHDVVPRLVAMDASTAQTSIVTAPAPGFLHLNVPIMLNAHHAFDTPLGAFLFVGMAEAFRKRCTQQLLLYRLGGGEDGRAIPGGALHLAWQTHVTWTSCQDKGEPALPAGSGSMLAIQVTLPEAPAEAL